MALTIGDNFSYQGAKPLDARLKYATLAEMVAKAESTLYDGLLAYCVEADKTYQWKSTNEVDATLGKWREFETGNGGDAVVYTPGGSYTFATKPAASASTLGFVYDITDDFTTTADFKEGAGIDYPAGTDIAVVNVGTVENPVYKYNVLMGSLANYQKKMQFAVMPTADNSHVGWIVQYMGATVTGSYTHGYFYECVTDGTTYSWEATDVQGSADGKAESSAIAPIFDATATYAAGDRVMYEDELYVFNKAHTGAWDAADADKTDVDSEIPDKLTSQQMQEIKNAFSGMNKGAPLRMMHYSTSEQIVGTWIDGKPLYQRVIQGTTVSNSVVNMTDIVNGGIPNADNARIIECYVTYTIPTGTWNGPIPNSFSSSAMGSINIMKDASKLYFGFLFNDYDNKPFTAIIQYTKTTD